MNKAITPINLLIVLGPTASGKTRLAVQLARHYSGEIVSADSRQVYRGLDIGSGKDLAEYGEVPCHLIDIIEPQDEFSVYDFQLAFFDTINSLQSRNTLPILCGGSGLYLEAALKGYRMVSAPENPTLRARLADYSDEALKDHLLSLKSEQHNQTDLQDRARIIRAIEIAECERDATPPARPCPPIQPLLFGIRWQRQLLRQHITRRLHERLDNGLIDEVQRLHQQGVSWERLHYFGLEYRYVADYLQGHLNKNDMLQKLNSAIHQFAKRQDTWFRRMERQGFTLHWLDGNAQVLEEALQILQHYDVRSATTHPTC